jgi:hypothetical protein
MKETQFEEVDLNILTSLLVEFDLGYELGDDIIFPPFMASAAPRDFLIAPPADSHVIIELDFVPSGFFGRVVCRALKSADWSERSSCRWRCGTVIDTSPDAARMAHPAGETAAPIGNPRRGAPSVRMSFPNPLLDSHRELKLEFWGSEPALRNAMVASVLEIIRDIAKLSYAGLRPLIRCHLCRVGRVSLEHVVSQQIAHESARMMRCSNLFCSSAMDSAECVDLAVSAVAALELVPSPLGRDGSGSDTLSIDWPLLFEPIYKGDVKTLRQLLSAADAVHVDSVTGVSSLMIAMSIMSNQLEVVGLLIEHGCPLEQVTTRAVAYGSVHFKSQWSALMVGCERGATRAVELLAKRTAQSVGLHPWNFRLWVGAVLVARANTRFQLAEHLQSPNFYADSNVSQSIQAVR